MSSSNPRDNNEGVTLGSGSRVQVGLLVTLIALVIPCAAAYLQVRNDLMAIRADIRTIRNNMGDRWSASMMVLYSERLGTMNPSLKVPDPMDVKKSIPLPQDLP